MLVCPSFPSERDLDEMNIFANTLDEILRVRKKSLGSLYSAGGISPSRVTRLKKSVEANFTAMLNGTEIEEVARYAGLSDEEVCRLRAAIIAEAVHHTLAGRMEEEDALRLAEQIFNLLLSLKDSGETVNGISVSTILSMIR